MLHSKQINAGRISPTRQLTNSPALEALEAPQDSSSNSSWFQAPNPRDLESTDPQTSQNIHEKFTKLEIPSATTSQSLEVDFFSSEESEQHTDILHLSKPAVKKQALKQFQENANAIMEEMISKAVTTVESKQTETASQESPEESWNYLKDVVAAAFNIMIDQIEEDAPGDSKFLPPTDLNLVNGLAKKYALTSNKKELLQELVHRFDKEQLEGFASTIQNLPVNNVLVMLFSLDGTTEGEDLVLSRIEREMNVTLKHN